MSTCQPVTGTSAGANTVVLYENSTDHAGDFGMNILFGDGHAELGKRRAVPRC